MIKQLAELGVLPPKRFLEPHMLDYDCGFNECLSDCAGRKIEVKWDKLALAKKLYSEISIDEYGEIKIYGLEVAWSRLPKWHKDFFLGVAKNIEASENSILTITAIKQGE